MSLREGVRFKNKLQGNLARLRAIIYIFIKSFNTLKNIILTLPYILQ